MPRIPDQFLNCVCYLYPSAADAGQGTKIGGTGFFVSVLSEPDRKFEHVYAVTNAHNIENRVAVIIRLNTTDDETDVIETEPAQWVMHPKGDDVAVCPIELSKEHRVEAVPTSVILTELDVNVFRIGIGDDVFMLGRYIDHEGTQKNQPSARFGTISMVPGELVYQDKRHRGQESYIVEMRSLSGYSGSPVFVYWYYPTVPRGTLARLQTFINREEQVRCHLLGIDWGHNPFEVYLREQNRTIHTYSAMANVVPAWKLTEILQLPDLVARRKAIDDKRNAESKERGGAILDAS